CWCGVVFGGVVGVLWCVGWCFFFFFQAEDGIRDKLVTGVQTCALPILPAATSASALRDSSCSAWLRLASAACHCPRALSSPPRLVWASASCGIRSTALCRATSASLPWRSCATLRTFHRIPDS